MRKVFALAAALAALSLSPAAGADSSVFVGIADDGFKWHPEATLPVARDLGATGVRVTLRWQPGEAELSEQDRAELDGFVPAAFGLRVVVAVYGAADDAPRSDDARRTYCSFVASLLRRYPTVNDVVIWNEPNLGLFWLPQFADDGSSSAPAAYAALLAACWDRLHEARPSVNVISNVSSRGNDRPRAISNVSHSPVAFLAALGHAYRSSGRTRPVLDTFGLHPYSASSESPAFDHGASTQISQGDVSKLVALFGDAFGGTAQPLIGCGEAHCPRVWLLEAGFQTRPAEAKQALYTGMETDPTALLDSAGDPSGRSLDHGRQLRDALTLAYCQPAVGAFFNFLLADEPDLVDWQSGVLWVDGTPKGSFASFAQAARAVGSGSVDCTSLERGEAARSSSGPTQSATAAASTSQATRPAPQVASTRVAPSVRASIVRRLKTLFPRGVAGLEIRSSARAKGWYLADGYERRTSRPVAVWFRMRVGRLGVVFVATTVRRLNGPAAAPCDLRPALGRPRCSL